MSTASSGEGHPERNGRMLFEALVTREPRPRANTMLRDLFGRSSRKGQHNRADTNAAAAALGLSPGTVRTWIRQGLPPGSQAAALMVQQWKNSPVGRKRRVDPKAQKKFTTPPKKTGAAAVSGLVVGAFYVSNDVRNGKQRKFKFDMDTQQSKTTMQAMMDGDDKEAYETWVDAIGQDFYGGSLDAADFTSVQWDP